MTGGYDLWEGKVHGDGGAPAIGQNGQLFTTKSNSAR
jgi:hypothetical protein